MVINLDERLFLENFSLEKASNIKDIMVTEDV